MAAKTARQKRDDRDARLREEGRSAAIQELNLAQFQNPLGGVIAGGEVVKPQSAGDKVIVGCKLDVASYALQMCRIEDKFEQNMTGGRMIRESTRDGRVVVLRGTAYPRGTPPKGFPAAPIVVDGAALNFNVDREFIEAWLKQNRLNPVVMNNLIFIADNIDSAQGMAKDTAEVLSGLGPIVPGGKDPRVSRSSRKDEVSDVEAGQR